MGLYKREQLMPKVHTKNGADLTENVLISILTMVHGRR